MGRPYSKEIARFPETYEWALGRDVSTFAASVRETLHWPLLAVGSGGSLSAAHYCCDWHQLATGRLARPATPFEVVSLGRTPRDTAVAVFSAGGRNKDILKAFEVTVASEPPAAWVWSGAKQSPLMMRARGTSIPVVFAERSLAGVDGFLATNSLLISCVLTHRAYEAALGLNSSLPPTWNDLVASDADLQSGNLATLWSAETIVVLHGYGTRAAALDFESKCTEAALAQVQVSDYRNFAHGRHNWLSKRDKTTVFALAGPEDQTIAERTLSLLPDRVSSVVLRIPHPGMIGGLRALVATMRIVEAGGRARGLDPGRPGVEKFGRKLYSLRAINDINGPSQPASAPYDPEASVAIERKARKPAFSMALEERLAWYDAYGSALAALGERHFVGLVLDYDGTVVDVADRFHGPRAEIIAALVRLLRKGLPIAIATGRGHSAGDELRARLPNSLWKRVVVGYYNGSVIAPLSDTKAPRNRRGVGSALSDAFEALSSSTIIAKRAQLTARESQITIEPCNIASIEDLWDATHGALLRAGVSVRVVRSTHSIDVLCPTVSKLALVSAARKLARASVSDAVLRIGDAAVWPGNDAELLAGWDGLSVSEVSSDPESAWSFAPAGLRGVQATLLYLGSLIVDRHGRARFSRHKSAKTSADSKPRKARAAQGDGQR